PPRAWLHRCTPTAKDYARTQNTGRVRTKYASKAVDETIRRARTGADGTRAGNSQSNPAAVVRSVSAEADVRCDFRQKGPCQRQVVGSSDKFHLASLNLLRNVLFPIGRRSGFLRSDA